ncbi:GntR family transcriptional regulator [Stieleria varia]|uniref:HTH-type transcriptional repressor YtrA n=1 Tax=Stieleria varia TaxID=2528005 RepID=A0A5C6BA52_9BACT|nr:GntR family transcriptional regulator [Stieleria varia]TWU08321.1 HTH-type transcriptional repressor YtrA [Stieleria varia]
MSISSGDFNVSPSSGVPIFRQIIDQVVAMIASGALVGGDMLPSTREMARSLEVNMMTVSKAYSRLESDGIAQRVRGRGMQICASTSKGSLGERKTEFSSHLEPAIHRGRQLGLTDAQILSIVKTMLGDQ